MNRVIGVVEVVLIPVDAVLRNLDDHFITLWPSTWSWASNGGGVDELNL